MLGGAAGEVFPDWCVLGGVVEGEGVGDQVVTHEDVLHGGHDPGRDRVGKSGAGVRVVAQSRGQPTSFLGGGGRVGCDGEHLPHQVVDLGGGAGRGMCRRTR